MKPYANTLIKRLEFGSYIMYIDAKRRASALPITEQNKKDFKTKILDLCGSGSRPHIAAFEQGFYLVSKDTTGYIVDLIPITKKEQKAFIMRILGAF